MHVDIIESAEALSALKADWDAVYDRDSGARYFLSHRFLTQWLTSGNSNWFVLAARRGKPGSPYEAFWPLRINIVRRPDGRYVNAIRMAGNYNVDYTGILCVPGVEAAAVSAFAARLKQLNWCEMLIDYVPSVDERYKMLQRHFSRGAFTITPQERLNLRDNVDNLICPYVALPADFDAFLDGLSANMRQKLRRFLRALDADPDLTITLATPDTIGRNVEDLGRLWTAKWSDRKGVQQTIDLVRHSRLLLRQVWQMGDLYMPVLRYRGRTIALLATFLDPLKHAAHFYMTGRDESFEDGPPPGLLLHAWSIRDLIGKGFTCYDFMRGNEPYKFLFGSEPYQLQCLHIGTNDKANLGNRLAPSTIKQVIASATALHQRGKLLEAASGYSQVLEQEPDNADALFRYGQLLERTEEFEDAGRLYQRIVRLHPKSGKAWRRIAHCLDKLGFAEAAEEAQRQAVRSAPLLTQ